ncbi:30S ribosomal protein S6 [Patescibacteria group bacterium]|nr:30S ribosomal protein S6 [Patescibacteria group bacterium]
MTNHYELLYILSGQFTEEEVEKIKETIKKLIAKFEGIVSLEDSLGKKRLAYPIKKIMQGYYLLVEFNLDGQNLIKLNDEIKLEPKVLRHLITKKVITAPSFVDKTKKLLETEPAAQKEELKKADEKKKVSIEDLDQKLDEILDGDIL